MNERYQSKEMKKIWSLKNRYDTFLVVEKEASKAFAKLGVVPQEDLSLILQNAHVNLDRVLEIEQETKHDVVAFTRAVSETLGQEAKWIHYGLTSTDVVDTANGLLFKEANELILKAYNALIETVKKLALKYQNTPCIGRTHGVHADITTFGLKFALFYDELLREKETFLHVKDDVEAGKISGAVGNYANIDPFVEQEVCFNLRLKRANISTQVLSRDRYAAYFSNLALIGSILERMATEIRSLARTEISEVKEHFSQGQKGSSAMPHKKNPVSCENICGLSRVLRGYSLTALENVNLWHERDISHSSAERIIFEDCTSLIEYMLKRFNNILSNLSVDEERMKENILLTNGNIFSQRVLTKLISCGLTRESAYDLVQPLTFLTNKDHNFKDILLENQDILKHLSKEEIEECFTYEYYFKQVNYIYKNLNLI